MKTNYKMNIRNKIYSITLLMVGTFSQQLYAQVQQVPNVPKVIPPSPEAATLLQHSPVNVSLYTGTPNISVPFHTISHGGVEVPISLSYSSDGIRVDNIASWAGLGWSLNAGGIISRTVNKLPDDTPIGYMNTSYTMADLLSRDSRQPAVHGGWGSFGGPQDQPWQLSHSHDGKYRDYEPDMFNFSFLGYSGQFYYNQAEGKFDQAPLSNLKIETMGAGIITGFIITDEAGIKYYFGLSRDASREGRERLMDAVTKSLIAGSIQQASSPAFALDTQFCYQSWMLMDIVLPNSAQDIQFKYFTEVGVETYMLTGEELQKEYIGCQEINTHYLLRKFNQPKLESITFPTGKVLFEKMATSRLDLKNSYALKAMTLLDNKGIQIRKMLLNTSYRQSTQGNNTGLLFDQSEIDRGRQRLWLDSVSLFGKAGTEKQEYVFGYNATSLPNRYSKATDYFGYYNGRNSNTSFLSRIYLPVVSSYIGTANRSIDPAYTRAGVLERITYPTGGHDEFDWENNSISFFGGIAQSYREHLKDFSFHFTSDLSLFGDPDPAIDFSTIITIPENVSGMVDFSIVMSGCMGQLNQHECDFTLKIIGVGNTVYNLTLTEPRFALSLLPGSYKVIANSKEPYVPPTQTTSSPFSFSMDIRWSTDPTPGEMLYAGLRIREIKSYDAPGSHAFSKSYEYVPFQAGSSSASSGCTVNMIDVLNTDFWLNCMGVSTSADGAFKLSSNSIATLVYTKGSLVGYRNVREKFNKGLQGYNEYTYSFMNEYLDPALGPAPYNGLIPATHRNQLYCDWLRGNLEFHETFDRQGNKLARKVYLYETDNKKGIQFAGIQTLIFPHPHISHGLSWYSAVTEHHRLASVTEINYLDGNEVSTTKEYVYNMRSQVFTESVFDNGQLDRRTMHLYPGDTAVDSHPHAAGLNAQNRIGTPLSTTVFDAGGRLFKQETEYRDWDPGVKEHLSPEVIKAGKGGRDEEYLEPRVRYNAVDLATGNPLEVEQQGGMKTSYIWGYDGTQPVAKIENRAYSSIPAGLISAIHSASVYKDGISYSEALLTEKLDALRTDAALAGAMVTTYTYQPLVGITSITDPKGDKVTYHYDNFGRLQFVRDKDNNILSENQYHYRPQN